MDSSLTELAPSDLAAITAVIADVETAFNTNDADLMVAHVTDDVIAAAVSGATVDGRAEMLDVSRRLLDGPLRDQFARYEVDLVRLVAPDVALVRKLAHATDAAGVDLDVGHAMVALYVMVRGDDRWRIAARHNTLVA